MSARTLAATTIVYGLLTGPGMAAPLAMSSVSAEGNIWLAGMPAGTVTFTDSVPANAPAQAVFTLVGGQALTFTATGLADHCGNFSCGATGPEGEAGSTSHFFGALNNISDVVAPLDGLIGVFLGPSVPTVNAAPPRLSFAFEPQRDFVTLTPLLQQVFFIGDGRRADGTSIQTFIVPAGATRLYLGTMDGFGWAGNSGAFDVAIDSRSPTVPEPTTFALAAVAALSMCAGARRRHLRRVA
jgi:hypothetical protein